MEAEKVVAIKVVSRLPRHRFPGVVQDDDLDEATITKGLNHANIVRLLDSFVDPGKIEMLVLEYLPGGDLYNAVNEEEVSPDQYPSFMIQLTSALEYMHGGEHTHRPQLVHFDVKLDNVLLDETFQVVKLCDFGLTGRNGSTRRGVPHGTPEYMAPELFGIKKDGSYTLHPGQDIWSLGSLVMYLLFGRLPWKVADIETDTEYRVFVNEGDGVSRLMPWATMAPPLRDCLLSMFDPSPRKRPSARAVGKVLTRISASMLSMLVPLAPPQSPSPHAMLSTVRHRGISAAEKTQPFAPAPLLLRPLFVCLLATSEC
jgi:serine/threonine protein kinase